MDVTVVLTAHNENHILYQTLDNLRVGIAHCESKGISVETVVVLDRANPLTVESMNCWIRDNEECRLSILETSYGDPGPARMHGLRSSAGRYVAILDGDDLFGESWLSTAFGYLEAHPDSENIVVHPEISIAFKGASYFWKHEESDSAGFSSLALIEKAAWTALSMAHRSVFERFPCGAARTEEGFGFEDWHWNCEVLAAGVIHKVVPETVHLIRLRGGDSRSRVQLAAGTIPPPSGYTWKVMDSVRDWRSLRREALDSVPAPSWTTRLTDQTKVVLRRWPALFLLSKILKGFVLDLKQVFFKPHSRLVKLSWVKREVSTLARVDPTIGSYFEDLSKFPEVFLNRASCPILSAAMLEWTALFKEAESILVLGSLPSDSVAVTKSTAVVALDQWINSQTPFRSDPSRVNRWLVYCYLTRALSHGCNKKIIFDMTDLRCVELVYCFQRQIESLSRNGARLFVKGRSPKESYKAVQLFDSAEINIPELELFARLWGRRHPVFEEISG